MQLGIVFLLHFDDLEIAVEKCTLSTLDRSVAWMWVERNKAKNAGQAGQAGHCYVML